MAPDQKKIKEIINEFIIYNNINRNYIEFDKNFDNLQEKFIRWLKGIETKDHDIFLNLFRNYRYYNRLEILSLLATFYNDFKLVEKEFEDSIFFPVTSYGGITNGAVTLIEIFREAVQGDSTVTKKKIAVQPIEFYNEFDLTLIRNLVLIDDVIGSGDTLINFLIRLKQNCNDLLEGRKIHVISLINLKKGMDNIRTFALENEIDITFVNETVIEKVFSNKGTLLDDKSLINAKATIKRYEKIVSSKPIYAMGYKKSEALVSFFYNTPNNTLSTFWEDDKSKNWYSVFPRDKSEDIFDLNENNSLKEIKYLKEQRKKTNTSIFKLINIEKERRKCHDN